MDLVRLWVACGGWRPGEGDVQVAKRERGACDRWRDSIDPAITRGAVMKTEGEGQALRWAQQESTMAGPVWRPAGEFRERQLGAGRVR